MNSKDSQSTGAKDYEFFFKYDGHVYKKEVRDLRFFYVDGEEYEDEASKEFLSMIRGFVKSALQGKTIHVKVL